MARLAIWNMMIGFSVVALAAAGGAFIATDLTTGYLRDAAILNSWLITLQSSSHGHTNLFGILHIALGLTMPYSKWSHRTKLLQTIGLGLGTIAMGPFMLVRGWLGPVESVDLTEILIGTCLSASLVAIVSHASGLAAKLARSP